LVRLAANRSSQVPPAKKSVCNITPLSTFDNVQGSIEKPRKDDIVGRSFECSGTVTGMGANSHLWLAVEINGLTWVKEGEIKPDSNNRWVHARLSCATEILVIVVGG
jgi:hypothetical protein